MEQEASRVTGAHFGGTVVAIVVAVVVLAVISVVVGMLFGALQYYVGGMHFEAAIFFGVIFGGVSGVHAARVACDAILKSYSMRAVFLAFATLCCLSFAGEAYKGFDWGSISRVAQILAIGITSWMIFWKNDY